MSVIQTYWRRAGYIVVRNLSTPERVSWLRATCERIVHQWRIAMFAWIALAALAAGSRADDVAAYPLKVGPTGRYLVDSRGKPFLLAGESPQAMMVNISEADADAFFANRRTHGFNAAWINLICAKYTGGREDSSTIDGLKPFRVQDDFSTPDEAYFAHCDRVIQLAAKHHTVVFLDPAETGSYLAVMQKNGIDKCRAYGRYLGKRYARFDNIVWMHGNDYDKHTPENDALSTAIVQGIKEFDHRHIHTAELDAGDHGNTIEDPRWAAIIDLNAAYTYGPTYLPIIEAYNQQHKMPTFLVESGYEFEHLAPADDGSPHQLRVEEYQVALSGSTGQLYGNGYTWPFKPDWKSKLDTPGAIQFGYLQKALLPRRWWELVPDEKHELVTAGYGTFGSYDYVTAGMAPDGSLAVIYMPTARKITVDLARFTRVVAAQWYDPASGRYSPAAEGRLANSGFRAFEPPGDNADGPGNSDWVLILETRPPRLAGIKSGYVVKLQPPRQTSTGFRYSSRWEPSSPGVTLPKLSSCGSLTSERTRYERGGSVKGPPLNSCRNYF